VFIAGEQGDGCYRIDQGLLKVSTLSASGGERILAIVGAETVVGQRSLLDGGPRSATVAAIRDSELKFIGSADFRAFAEAHPQVYNIL
jgi:CRP/FNR family transcriptional regulator, cyclic AMP receptor protein